jgi:hypothetical protein
MSSPEGNSSKNLKQVFESAVGDLEDDSSSQRKRPICPRKNGVRLEAAPQDHNRALNDAAEALAALWKTTRSAHVPPGKEQTPRRLRSSK